MYFCGDKCGIKLPWKGSLPGLSCLRRYPGIHNNFIQPKFI